MEQFDKVCGLKIVSTKPGEKANIKVKGIATNNYAGRSVGPNIWISTIRNMSARDGFILGGIIMHEIGHTIGLVHTSETDAYRDYIMHPWGPIDDWWSPSEVKFLQLLYGEPVNRFLIHEIVYVGNLLRSGVEKLEGLFLQRNNLWETYNKTGDPAILEKLNKKIAEIRTTQNNNKKLRIQRLQRIDLWKKSVVPKSIVPLIKPVGILEKEPLPIIDMNLLVCGCALDNLSQELWSVEDDLLQQPVY